MSIPKNLDFNDYDNYPADENPTTDAEMQEFMRNQNALMQQLAKLLWQPQTSYIAGTIIFSGSLPVGTHAVVTTAGLSGNQEPNWSNAGSYVQDGGVIWLIVNDVIINNASRSKNLNDYIMKTDVASKGASNTPVYFDENGFARDLSYQVNATVPSNAKFTDTVTTVTNTGSGNAVTAISANNGVLTITKGSTFSLSNHTHGYISSIHSALSLAQNGYCKFNNGLVVQWGRSASGAATRTVTFPVAFGTIYTAVVVDYTQGDSDTGGYDYNAAITGLNTTTMIISIGKNSVANWIAIGRT